MFSKPAARNGTTGSSPTPFLDQRRTSNRETTGAMELLGDLNMRTVRVSFPLSALAPAVDRIDLSNFATDSANLGK